ncbi:MAG: DUF2946 domain-containing protein [Pseudomonadota bacterium]
MTNNTRRLIAWIACFAMLFGALAPSIAQAMSSARGEVWAEVCSVSGPKLVKASIDPVKQQTEHLEHCPFCVTQAAPLALLPSADGLSFAALVLPDSYPVLFYQSPRPLSIWSTAQSRAPPPRV